MADSNLKAHVERGHHAEAIPTEDEDGDVVAIGDYDVVVVVAGVGHGDDGSLHLADQLIHVVEVVHMSSTFKVRQPLNIYVLSTQ